MNLILKLCKLTIPFSFETKEEELEVKKNLETAFSQLKNAAIRLKVPAEIINPIVSLIERRKTLQRQQKDILWLATLLAHYVLDPKPEAILESPLCDQTATSLIKSIWATTDPSLRKKATSALISIYTSSEKKEMLKTLMDEKKEHLHLILLFSIEAGLQKGAIVKLLDDLSPRKYKDISLITPIIEIVCALSKSALLSLEKKQELLAIAFTPPVKGDREPVPKYQVRLEQFRQDQTDYVSALHTLLFFGQESLLESVTDTSTLVSKWQTFMGETFHVEASVLPGFMKTFVKSKRYPNGLPLYASRLQVLPEDEKQSIMPLLGKFTAAVLNGTYPQIRYDFDENPHLQTLFSNDEELFKKWQKSLPIKIDRTAQETAKIETPQELVQRLTRQTLSDSHLGPDQKSTYPELESVLAGSANLASLKETVQKADEPERNRTTIVLKCAELLDPKSDPHQLKAALNALLNLLSDGVEFKRDVKAMLNRLSAPKSFPRNWTIEDTDFWEDMLLMGTEVDNSCQDILGDADYNKCLLSYILDGKSRIMIARDPSGKIIGRAVLRILWDEIQKKQVLFVERLYTGKGDYQSLKQDILEGCKQKAQDMGLSLVASVRDYKDLKGKKYPGPLRSLGGPAPYEYVDALNGIEHDGIYTINESYLLWSNAPLA
jgi:hypothetical protein